jgi:hypothetical protein
VVICFSSDGIAGTESSCHRTLSMKRDVVVHLPTFWGAALELAEAGTSVAK